MKVQQKTPTSAPTGRDGFLFPPMLTAATITRRWWFRSSRSAIAAVGLLVHSSGGGLVSQSTHTHHVVYGSFVFVLLGVGMQFSLSQPYNDIPPSVAPA